MSDKNRYQSTFSHIRASETLRMEVLNMKPENTNIRSRKRHWKPLLITAVLLCLLAGTALAVALNENLLSYFETQWYNITGNSME